MLIGYYKENTKDLKERKLKPSKDDEFKLINENGNTISIEISSENIDFSKPIYESNVVDSLLAFAKFYTNGKLNENYSWGFITDY